MQMRQKKETDARGRIDRKCPTPDGDLTRRPEWPSQGRWTKMRRLVCLAVAGSLCLGFGGCRKQAPTEVTEGQKQQAEQSRQNTQQNMQKQMYGKQQGKGGPGGGIPKGGYVPGKGR
jgi:hypothetical protein